MEWVWEKTVRWLEDLENEILPLKLLLLGGFVNILKLDHNI